MSFIKTLVASTAVRKAFAIRKARDGNPRERTLELTGRYPGEDEDEDEPLQQARRKRASKRKGSRASKTDRLGG